MIGEAAQTIAQGYVARMKIILQLVIAFVATLIFIELSPNCCVEVAVPFFKDTLLTMGLFMCHSQ